MRCSGFSNSAHEPVVKSCSRVPTREHQVGLVGERVGGGGAGDADRAHAERMVVGSAALAGLRLGDRNAGALRQKPRSAASASE